MPVIKVYEGHRESLDSFVEKGNVTVNGKPLHNYFPHTIGFEWGYSGTGPLGLSLSILCDYFNVPENISGEDRPNYTVTQWQYYWRFFLEDFVKKWPRMGFRISSEEIATWLACKPSFQEGKR